MGGAAGAVQAQPAASVGGGLNQIGPRIIDHNRIDQTPAAAPVARNSVPERGHAASTPPPGIEDQTFTLQDVTVEGATAFGNERLHSLWAAKRGHTLRVRDVYAISDAVAQQYADAGYALYSVSVPRQDFQSGHVRIHVTEGYVELVSIVGNTDGADLSVLKAQGARIAGNGRCARRRWSATSCS